MLLARIGLIRSLDIRILASIGKENSSMFCPTCGKDIPDASTFCLHCGNKISAPTPSKAHIEKRASKAASTPGTAITKLFLMLGVLGVVLIIWLFVAQRNRSSPSSDATIVDTITQPAAVPHPIVDNAFEVNALSYVYYSFSVPQRARITGTFWARGGKNDIEVVIFDEAGFENFKNGNLAERVYYSSRGYVTTATIDKYVPPGSYFLVFNNKDALITGKAVTAKIDAEY
jgi:hypothetical protein